MRRADPIVKAWEDAGVTADVHRKAIFWEESILPRDYKSLKKAKFSFWCNTVRFEHRCRMELGYFVLWHNVEADCMTRSALVGKYIPIPRWWVEGEMPQGFWAELPPVFAYAGSAVLSQPSSGWWVVNCTQWVINVTMYLVWDAYDTGRLWHFPPRILAAFRTLPFEVVLGKEGAADLHLLALIIEGTDWSAVPAHQTNRQKPRRNNFLQVAERKRGTSSGWMLKQVGLSVAGRQSENVQMAMREFHRFLVLRNILSARSRFQKLLLRRVKRQWMVYSE